MGYSLHISDALGETYITPFEFSMIIGFPLTYMEVEVDPLLKWGE